MAISTNLTLYQQAESVADRCPMAWALWLVKHSDCRQEQLQALIRYQYVNPGLHPEYVADWWLYNLHLSSFFSLPTYG
jgi:hypothetical protein